MRDFSHTLYKYTLIVATVISFVFSVFLIVIFPATLLTEGSSLEFLGHYVVTAISVVCSVSLIKFITKDL